MTVRSPSRLERLSHEAFAASLRAWCNSEPEEARSPSALFAAWINALADRLAVGLKVDVAKIAALDGLSEVERAFLAVAAPSLAYFARSSSPGDGGEPCALVPRLKFRNVLLRLLTNASGNRAVARMRRFLLGPDELEPPEPSEGPDSDAEPADACAQPSAQALQAQHREAAAPAAELGDLAPSRVPRLYIEYVEPSPGLFAPPSFSAPKPGRPHCPPSCRGAQSPGSWAESLRGGFVPSHIRVGRR